MGLVEIVLPVFGIIFFGWFCRRIKLFDEKAVGILSAFAYFIAFPALFFVSLYKTDFSLISDPLLLLVYGGASLIILGGTFAVLTLLNVKGEIKGVFILGAFLSNAAYMGIPLNKFAFGENAVAIAVIVAAINFFLGLTLGVFILQYYSSKNQPVKEIFLSVLKIPLMWSVVLGVIASFVKLQIPGFLDALLSMLSASASPVALFAIGLFFYKSDFFKEFKLNIAISLTKLLIFPLIVFALAIAVGFSGLKENVALLQAATPLAVTTFVLAERFDIKKELMANTVIFSTMLSMLTISILLLLIGT